MIEHLFSKGEAKSSKPVLSKKKKKSGQVTHCVRKSDFSPTVNGSPGRVEGKGWT
jgi:hypothetical protein